MTDGKRRALITLTELDLEQLLDLPDGYQIHHVGGDFLRSAVVIVVGGDDFDPVPHGAEPPLLHGVFSREQVVVDGKVFFRWAWQPKVSD